MSQLSEANQSVKREPAPLDSPAASAAGDAPDIRESLLKMVIEAYENGYKELADAWRSLETKAQGNIAIAGIFIGGVFAYIQKVDPQLQRNEKVLLGIAVFLLIMSVIFSIATLKTRTVKAPPFGRYIDTLVTDLLEYTQDNAALTERVPGFCYDQIYKWREVEQEVSASIHFKALSLRGAQLFLTVAILTVGLLTLMKVFF